MSFYAQIRDHINSVAGQEYLARLYGSQADASGNQVSRILTLLDDFSATFPRIKEIELFSSPGRTEIGGNHTDHENGRVLAAAIDLDSVSVAGQNDEDVVRIRSGGFDPVNVSLEDLSPHPEEVNTSSALVRGTCQFLRQAGFRVGGFSACITSNVPGGSGLSSSASFEMLVAEIINQLLNSGKISRLDMARAGQFAESQYFQKPCGLMDQMTIATGGLVMIDFKDPLRPQIRQVDLDLEKSGYSLIITETGGSHAGLTKEYASIISDNRTVAGYFGVQVLRDVNEEKFMASLPELRQAMGDRAILRAKHFFEDDERVVEQVSAIERRDIAQFLSLVNESGMSSWVQLQNCQVEGNSAQQGIPLALTLSADYLGKHGAWRVHGGGFAGTIQAFVPTGMLDGYIQEMERVFGNGACLRLNIRPSGVTKVPA
jgi:galactokinase